MTRSAEATVRRPGTRIAPITSTSTCSQVGAVKASRKGCRTLTRLFGTPCPVAPAMHPSPNQWLGETRQVRVRCEHRRLSRRTQVTHDSSGLDTARQGAGRGAMSLPSGPRQPPPTPEIGQTQAEGWKIPYAIALHCARALIHATRSRGGTEDVAIAALLT